MLKLNWLKCWIFFISNSRFGSWPLSGESGNLGESESEQERESGRERERGTWCLDKNIQLYLVEGTRKGNQEQPFCLQSSRFSIYGICRENLNMYTLWEKMIPGQLRIGESLPSYVTLVYAEKQSWFMHENEVHVCTKTKLMYARKQKQSVLCPSYLMRSVPVLRVC